MKDLAGYEIPSKFSIFVSDLLKVIFHLACAVWYGAILAGMVLTHLDLMPNW